MRKLSIWYMSYLYFLICCPSVKGELKILKHFVLFLFTSYSMSQHLWKRAVCSPFLFLPLILVSEQGQASPAFLSILIYVSGNPPCKQLAIWSTWPISPLLEASGPLMGMSWLAWICPDLLYMSPLLSLPVNHGDVLEGICSSFKWFRQCYFLGLILNNSYHVEHLIIATS